MVPVHALTHYLTGPLEYLISYTLYTPKNATWRLLLQRINDIGQNINWMHIWELMLIWTAIGQSWLYYSHVTWYDTCTKECNLMILWQKINPFGIKNWWRFGQNMDSNVSRPNCRYILFLCRFFFNFFRLDLIHSCYYRNTCLCMPVLYIYYWGYVLFTQIRPIHIVMII